jgi:ABC-type sulfate/molybdate transport systems ATPase subunit
MDPDQLTADIHLPRRAFALRLALRVGLGTVAVLGPSGSGKSTLLRAIAGLERPTAGHVALGGEVWFDAARRISLPPERRAVGMVLQELALFPHLTAAQNVGFSSPRRAPELMRRFGIAHLADARPDALSGGERQRVALARAIARDPRVLLLDEPLSALDADTRGGVRAELADLLRELGVTTLLVSHDFEDAATLAVTVIVIDEGRIVQSGTPDDLVARPATPLVARLTGANLLGGGAGPGPAGLSRVVLDDGTVVHSTDAGSGRVGVAVQPVDITIATHVQDASTMNQVPGRVGSVVRLGNRARVRVGDLAAEITVASLERLALREGDHVVAAFKATATRLVTPPARPPADPGDGTPAGREITGGETARMGATAGRRA